MSKSSKIWLEALVSVSSRRFVLLKECGGLGLMNIQDERNTHFILFEFKKAARKGKSDSEWEKLMSKGEILKACEYKRR